MGGAWCLRVARGGNLPIHAGLMVNVSRLIDLCAKMIGWWSNKRRVTLVLLENIYKSLPLGLGTGSRKMTNSLRFKKRVLEVLDPGRKNRDILSIQPSGAVEINTDRILNSATGRSQIRAIERMSETAPDELEQDELKQA